MYVTVRSTVKFLLSAHYRFAWYENGCHSEPFEFSLWVSIISNETKEAVPRCPSSLIYAAKSGRQATTVVAWFICCSVRQVSKEGLKHSNRVQIALACQLGSMCAAVFDCSRSCILAATASHPMLSLHPWCKSASYRRCVHCHSWLQSRAVHCHHVQCSASYEARPTMLCIRLVLSLYANIDVCIYDRFI